MKVFLTSIVLIMMSLSVSAIESRDLIEEGGIYTITADRVNLRTSDSVGDNIAGRLMTGDQVKVIDAGLSLAGEFILVEVVQSASPFKPSEEYYLSYKFISDCVVGGCGTSGDDDSDDQDTEPTDPSDDPRNALVVGKIYYITTNGVNVRSSDTFGDNILGRLNLGDSVRVLDNSSTYEGEFVSIEVVETSARITASEQKFLSYKFLADCPLDWRGATCGTTIQFKNILKVSRIDQMNDGTVFLTLPKIIRGKKEYSLDNLTLPNDACALFGFKAPIKATIYNNEYNHSDTLLYLSETNIVQRVGYGISTLACAEQNLIPRRSEPTTNLLIYEAGDFNKRVFESRGFKLFQGK